MPHLLILDDEELILNALVRALKSEEYTLDKFTSPLQALDKLGKTNYDVILADYRMPEMDGITFLKKAKQHLPLAKRIILSGQADFNGLVNAINEAEIFRFIFKPWNDDELKAILMQATAHKIIVEYPDSLDNL